MPPPIYVPTNPQGASLAEYQADFAEGLRAVTGSNQQAYGGRLQLYRTLIFNNLCSFIDACFPVCRALLSPTLWQNLCSAFLREHPCQSPLFQQIPLEFISWLQTPQRYRHPMEPIYLTHLAHYEYCELLLLTAPDNVPYGKHTQGARINTPLQLVCYPYAVHKLGPAQPNPILATTRLLVWRKADDSVGFAELNTNTYCLLELIQHTAELADLFTQWAPLCSPAPSPEDFVACLQQLTALGVVQVNL